MKRLALCLLALLVPVAGFAQELDGDTNVNLLITQPSYTGCADPLFDFIDEGNCADLTSDPQPAGAFVWVVYSHLNGWGNGVSGAQFGIDYDAAVQAWALCTGGAEIPEAGWPGAGTGNAVTWVGGCYNPVAGNARVGFFTVGAPSDTGSMAVIPDPRINDTQYTDCDTNLFSTCAQNLGAADLASGTVPLCENNCGTPVEEKSWGAIKGMFN